MKLLLSVISLLVAFGVGAQSLSEEQVSGAKMEKRVVISNKYCTMANTGSHNTYGVTVHILDPKTGAEINSEYVANPVTKEQALKLLDSATCD